MREINPDSRTPVFLEETESRITLENCFFPEPKRTAVSLVSGDELADMLEHVQRKSTPLHSFEEIELLGLTKKPGCNAFFDQNGARAIFCFVELLITAEK